MYKFEGINILILTLFTIKSCITTKRLLFITKRKGYPITAKTTFV